LTTRQLDIASLAVAGVTNKDIADRLGLSVRTVENHLQNAYVRLGVTTRAELAAVLFGSQQAAARSTLAAQ
jgi:DNA-binding NarL/FixJ family response regulator